MYKKIGLILIITLLCLIPLFKKQQNNDEIVLWTLQMSDFSPYMQKIISDFEKQENVKIKWVDVPFSEGEKRTLASILSDNPPDIINLNPDFSTMLAQKGALSEIDGKYAKQFNTEIINSLKYNGKLYSLPWYATSAVTIYNKNLFNKSGVKKLPETYDELIKISPIIKKNIGVFAFMPTITENDTMIKLLNKYGISNKNLSSQKSEKIFNQYKNLYQNNLIPKETITQTHREALEKYMSEQIVFFQGGANFLNLIKENSPDIYKNTDVSPQLKGDLGQNDFSLMNFIIPLNSKHKDISVKFILYLTNEENQLELGRLTNILATNEKALNNDFYKKYNKDDLQAKARCISAGQLKEINPVFKQSDNQKEINTLINTAVQEILIGKKNTREILKDLGLKLKIYNQ